MQHKSHQFHRKFKMKCHAFNLSKKEAFITMLTFLQIKLSIHRQSIDAWGKGSEMYILDEVELLLSSKQL